MGFGDGSTNNSLATNGTSNELCQVERNMISIFLKNILRLFQQPAAASFLPFIKNPILSAQSAILLLYSTQHIMFYRPFPTVFEVRRFLENVSPSGLGYSMQGLHW